MNYLVVNFTFVGSKMLENELDNLVFKDVAFGSKTSYQTPSNININYSHVLIPAGEGFQLPTDEFHSWLENSINTSFEFQPYEKASIVGFLEISDFLKKNMFNVKLTIDVIARISDNQIGIGYSDGSCKKSTNQASYACYKLLNESEAGAYDDFTGKSYEYEEFSEVIEDGTNNIGELSGIKKLIEEFSDKKFQLIISDSEYGLKCYREWIYNWSKNGYRTYSKKPISNKELICETFELMKKSGKTIFFKWVKGHNKNSFNEMCDIKAKEVLDS